MINAVRSELIRVSRRSFVLGGIGAVAGFAALISVFVLASATDQPSAPGTPDNGPPAVSIGEILEPGGFLVALDFLSNLTGIVILAIWAIAAASDYETGLIRLLVQAEPRRTRLLLGKIAALTGFTLATTATAMFVLMNAAGIWARFYKGIDPEAWKTDLLSHLASNYANFSIAMITWGLLGLMIAVVTRSSSVAIGIGVGYLLVVEGLLGIVAPDATTYTLGGAIASVIEGGTEQLAYGSSLALVAGYGATAMLVSLLTFRKRDIQS